MTDVLKPTQPVAGREPSLQGLGIRVGVVANAMRPPLGSGFGVQAGKNKITDRDIQTYRQMYKFVKLCGCSCMYVQVFLVLSELVISHIYIDVYLCLRLYLRLWL